MNKEMPYEMAASLRKGDFVQYKNDVGVISGQWRAVASVKGSTVSFSNGGWAPIHCLCPYFIREGVLHEDWDIGD